VIWLLEYVGEFISYTLLAVFAQNLLLDKSLGINCIMTAVSRKNSLPKMALVMGIYSTVGIMIMWGLSRIIFNQKMYLVCALVYSLFCAAMYFVSDRILLKISPETHDIWNSILPHALINSIIIGAPLAAFSAGIPNWWTALGYGIGSGLSFGFAMLIIKNGLEILDNPDIPKAFRGMPIMLIYLGILSLGFCVFL
jgi:electron transport complex protein RnfA